MHRDWEGWNESLFKDYFADDPKFDAMKFH
jgi:hypothetical protein